MDVKNLDHYGSPFMTYQKKFWCRYNKFTQKFQKEFDLLKQILRSVTTEYSHSRKNIHVVLFYIGNKTYGGGAYSSRLRETDTIMTSTFVHSIEKKSIIDTG